VVLVVAAVTKVTLEVIAIWMEWRRQ